MQKSVRANNFYQDAHQRIFKAIIVLYDKGHPVDLVTLANQLQDQKQIELYLAVTPIWPNSRTPLLPPPTRNITPRIVRERGMMRGLIHVCTEILRDAYDQSRPADEMLGTA